MGLFRRRKPLHERLADAGGIPLGATGNPPGASAEPPGWDGEPRGEPGIHGVPRARRWEVVASADAPSLRGDAVHFVTLEDGTLVVTDNYLKVRVPPGRARNEWVRVKVTSAAEPLAGEIC